MMHVVREYEERLNSIEAELEELNTEMDKLRELEEYHRILNGQLRQELQVAYGQPLTLGDGETEIKECLLCGQSLEGLYNEC